jgi:hypothetical protein
MKLTAIFFVAVLASMILSLASARGADILTHAQFTELLASNLLLEGKVIYDPQSGRLSEVSGRYMKSTSIGGPEVREFVARAQMDARLEDSLLALGTFETKQRNTIPLYLLRVAMGLLALLAGLAALIIAIGRFSRGRG